ncbi:putative ribonuclease H-like domain-containing protein [Tanacetum coccineum]
MSLYSIPHAQLVIPAAQLVPKYHTIGRCNNYVMLQSIPYSSKCKIVGRILIDHPLNFALTAIADVPTVFGYQGVVDKLSAFYTKNLAQPWKTMFKVFNRYLKTRTSGHDKTKINILQIFHAVINRTNVDYAALLWWDFMNNISLKRIEEDYHSIKDDTSLVSVYTTGDVRIRGMLISNECSNESTVTCCFYPRNCKSTPRAHTTPTLTASPQEKKRKHSDGESSSPLKLLKITIRQQKVVEENKDDDGFKDSDNDIHLDHDDHQEDDAPPEGEKRVKRHKASKKSKSEEETIVDDDEVIPEDETSEIIIEFKNVHKRVLSIYDRARMEVTLNDALSNQFINAEEYAYRLEQSTNFIKNQIVWESRQEDIRRPVPKPLVFFGPQRNPNEPLRYLYNKDLFFLKHGNTEEKKYILSLHKIHAELFPKLNLEEKMNRWVRKEFKNFNEEARLSIQHWKDSWHKRVYKQNQRKVKDNPKDYYSNHMIIEVVRITTDQPHGLDYMEQMIVMIENNKTDSFSRADFKYLNKNDIEDLYYLCQNKKERVHDFQLGIESYQIKVNLTAPTLTFTGIEEHELYSIVDKPSIGKSFERDDIMESVISYVLAKETWTYLVHSFEGPSNTKENKIMDLKLKYQTFRSKSTESLSQTYTHYKTLLNELANDGVNLSKHEINVGFVNNLPEKWLTFSQGLRNANHTQTFNLAYIYGWFVYEDNLIQRRYFDTKKALITTPSSTTISTAFFSNNNKGLVAETFDWDKEEVSDDEEVTQVKVLMALADDELTVGKNHAHNEEKQINKKWLTSSKKVSQCISGKIPHQKKKVLGGELFTESSSKMNENENLFIPAFMRILVPKSQVFNKSLKPTVNIPESSKDFEAESLRPLPPLKNLQGASPSSESVSETITVGKTEPTTPSVPTKVKNTEQEFKINELTKLVQMLIDEKFPDKVHKVEKALYGLHQAPRAWYETLSTYLLENRFRRGTIDKSLFIKKDKGELTFFLGLQVMQRDDGIFISQDKYMADILKKFDFSLVKTASTPIETKKALLKDEEAEDVDVHLYRSMIGSLMYLTASRLDIMFVVCACASFQVTPKVSHLHTVKWIFRYLKGQPKLGLWYPRDSPFDLEAFSESDYAGASLDRKSTTRGCQFLSKRLISWQCKKQTIVANSTTEEEYVAAANCCGQFVDQHSMIACLEKSEGNADFHEIVDFLTASTIHYALTTSVPIPNVADEAVFKEWDDRVVRATTTAASLDAAQASGNITKTQSTAMSNDPLSQKLVQVTDPGGHTPRSDEGRPNINELMAICKNLSNRVLALETLRTTQDLVIQKLKKKVRRLEKKLRARTPWLDLFKIEGDFDDIDDMVDDAIKNVEGDAKTQGRNSDKTEELNLSDKGSGGTEVFDDTTAAQKDVNAVEPVSTAGDAVTTASVIFDVGTCNTPYLTYSSGS